MLPEMFASWVCTVLGAFRSAIARPTLAMATGLLLLSLFPGIANATTRYWVAYNNGYWVYGPDWTNGVAPSGSENACINNGYTAWIQSGDVAVCNGLTLGDNYGQSGTHFLTLKPEAVSENGPKRRAL